MDWSLEGGTGKVVVMEDRDLLEGYRLEGKDVQDEMVAV